MSSFPLRPPDDLKGLAAAQAKASGVSLNQYTATVPASRVRAQAEAERSFAARAKRAIPGQAHAILARAGPGNELD